MFNYPDKFVFFKEECVEFNYKWLTEELEIDPEEITFVEDVWAGGGNLGPSIEYFINGLELGNMVFMQYKTFHDGIYFLRFINFFLNKNSFKIKKFKKMKDQERNFQLKLLILV